MSLFCNKTLRDTLQELGAFIWWMKNLSSMFLFAPSVRVEHFWVDLNGKHVFVPTPIHHTSAYLGDVYVILILRA